MQTFGDWLEYYNNLDVTPFLKTLEKMKAYYTDLGVDIFIAGCFNATHPTTHFEGS